MKLKNKIKNWKEISSEVISIFIKVGEKEPIVKKAIHWLQKEIY